MKPYSLIYRFFHSCRLKTLERIKRDAALSEDCAGILDDAINYKQNHETEIRINRHIRKHFDRLGHDAIYHMGDRRFYWLAYDGERDRFEDKPIKGHCDQQLLSDSEIERMMVKHFPKVWEECYHGDVLKVVRFFENVAASKVDK